MEIWKDIEGYNGQYQVSNLGFVFARKTYVKGFGGTYLKKPHVLKDACNGKGYRYVTISVNRRRKNHYVHVLVAKSFLPNPDNKPEVNHINGNKMDNRAENLEWVTHSENLLHAVKTGLRKTGAQSSHARRVYSIKDGIEFGCVKEVAELLNMNYGTLKDGLRRNRQYKGFSYYKPAS